LNQDSDFGGGYTHKTTKHYNPTRASQEIEQNCSGRGSNKAATSRLWGICLTLQTAIVAVASPFLRPSEVFL
jgi:hypothetical protein